MGDDEKNVVDVEEEEAPEPESLLPVVPLQKL